MAEVKKKKTNAFWANVRECLAHSIVPMLMYLAMSGVLLIVILKKADEDGNVSRGLLMTTTVICALLAAAYNALMAWACGGIHYEQLVSGNMKRKAAYESGYELNITSHKEQKEYRVWKGFAIGFFIGLPTLIGGIFFGCMQGKIQSQTTGQFEAILLLIFEFLAGWATLPFQYTNASHYGLSAIFCILPIVVTGVFYIVGAYSKRAKAVKKQMLADRAAAEAAAKPKKVNYGGLPGTKPKKKR